MEGGAGAIAGSAAASKEAGYRAAGAPGELEEAFIFERSIDQKVYERQRDKLQEELAIAELELHDARIDQTDVEGVLAFAEHLLTNIGSAWLGASLQQRQQIQAAIFPEGLPSTDGNLEPRQSA